ncbi:KICSTOR complex protein kaptin, partial [Zonotrichia leucophrys gambelii]|uniref:KICSTOR complex protein kaptin n=1 Tax=Zonotrichia leucophrys gambelii TaxID=257770 RepID=UPI003140A35A
KLLKRGLAEPLVLPGSRGSDAVVCAKVTDVDFDGAAEILLGTYGQELLCYKYFGSDSGGFGQFRPLWWRRFPSPLLALEPLDLTGDGLWELAVVCLGGLHVLQHSLEPTARLLRERLRREVQQKRGQNRQNREKTAENREKTTENWEKTTEKRAKNVEKQEKNLDSWEKTTENCGETTEKWGKDLEKREKMAENWGKNVENWGKNPENAEEEEEGGESPSCVPKSAEFQ